MELGRVIGDEMEEVLSGFNAGVGVQPRRHGQRPAGESLPLELGPGVKVGRNGAWVGQEWGPSSTIHHTHQRRMRVKASQPGMSAGIAHAFSHAILPLSTNETNLRAAMHF